MLLDPLVSKLPSLALIAGHTLLLTSVKLPSPKLPHEILWAFALPGNTQNLHGREISALR